MKVVGYGTEAEWDEGAETLTFKGTKMAGRTVLQTKHPVTLTRDKIKLMRIRPATLAANGFLEVHADRPEPYKVMFRKKQQPEWDKFAEAIGAERGATAVIGRDTFSGATRDGGCPKCGGSAFKTKRSAAGKLAGGLLAPKTQVKCLTCGAMYKRG